MLTGSPQSLMVWGLLFLGWVMLWGGPASPTPLGIADDRVVGKCFQVEMISPQYFRVKPKVQGPASSQLSGGKGSRQLITRQENGQTVIYVRIPLGATLTVRVGEYSLRLWMKEENSFEIKEECRPRAPANEEGTGLTVPDNSSRTAASRPRD
jgi:hypothetical protein